MGEINHFLIVFDLVNGELLEMRRFGTDVDEATDAYAELEGEWRDREDSKKVEIVLVGADSEDTLHVTHSRYFAKPGLARLY